MDIKIDKNPYQKNEFYTGEMVKSGIRFPFTLEIIDVDSTDSDYYINWQEVPPNANELNELILEEFKKR